MSPGGCFLPHPPRKAQSQGSRLPSCPGTPVLGLLAGEAQTQWLFLAGPAPATSASPFHPSCGGCSWQRPRPDSEHLKPVRRGVLPPPWGPWQLAGGQRQLPPPLNFSGTTALKILLVLPILGSGQSALEVDGLTEGAPGGSGNPNLNA